MARSPNAFADIPGMMVFKSLIRDRHVLLTTHTKRMLHFWGMASALGTCGLAGIIALNISSGASRLGVVIVGLSLGWLVYRRQTEVIRRRQRILSAPFPEKWRAVLTESVSYYRHLEPEDRTRFEQLIAIFLAETRITGVGVDLNDTHRLLIGASAVIPIMGFPGWEYRYLSEILVYPDRFDHDYQTGTSQDQRILGMVHGALNNGVLILSLPALVQGFKDPLDKHNVGIHEFSHIIDKQDGSIDGIPLTLSPAISAPWRAILAEIFQDGKPFPKGIDPYGKTNPQEFLAVLTEHYFENPASLKKRHPELFSLMEKMYQQRLNPRRVQILPR